jgi:MYXO-CTERM domain-containing protein
LPAREVPPKGALALGALAALTLVTRRRSRKAGGAR